MEAEIQKLLDSFSDMREQAHVNAVFGAPVTVAGQTIIPVARVSYGFGMGLGVGHGSISRDSLEADEAEGEASGGGTGAGGGGGATAQPCAIIEVSPEAVAVKSILNEQRLALAGALLAGWSVYWLSWALVKIFGRES